ncbi:DUF2318 domain-containing protein [Opitutaceae bacterium TAV4]|nr:DUF2318 domain-containing protein [Opitutaceae bacterium TAV4]
MLDVRRWMLDIRRNAPPPPPPPSSPDHRKSLAARRTARRLAIGLLTLSATACAAQLYWDQVASRPLQRTDALRIAADENGNVRLPLDLIADGQLHRYEWIADDGKIVRFFIINRHPGAVAPAVVFDACALCGDMGYVHRDDRVICIACGVNLVLPSVGKPGGCNPIVMENWRQTASEIIIPRDSLAAGAQMFTTSVETPAPDTPPASAHSDNPVCGAPPAAAATTPACCVPKS